MQPVILTIYETVCYTNEIDVINVITTVYLLHTVRTSIRKQCSLFDVIFLAVVVCVP